MKVLLACLLTMLPTMVMADEIDGEVNAIYTRMSAAYASFDSEKMRSVYDKDGAYLPPGIDDLVLKGHDMLLAKEKHVFSKMKQHGARLSIQFRVTDRKKADGMVTDFGYYKFTMTPSEDTGKEAKTSVGRFLTTSIPQEQGHWAFYSDMDTEANSRFYDEAPRIKGLKYDD